MPFHSADKTGVTGDILIIDFPFLLPFPLVVLDLLVLTNSSGMMLQFGSQSSLSWS
jgi:hypothetical protein